MRVRGKQNEVLGAIPGARASLRWYGWLGIGLLVPPAVILAMFAVQGQGPSSAGWLDILLLLISLLALAGAGLLLFLIVSSLRRLGELTRLLCEHSHDPVFIKDSRHRYRFVNELGAALIGRRPADILGRRDGQLRSDEEALAFEENDRVCLDRDLPTMFRETRLHLDGGPAVFWFPSGRCTIRGAGLQGSWVRHATLPTNWSCRN